MNIHIVYTRTSDAWWIAEAPFLDGAVTQGKTKMEAKRNLLSLIKELLVMYREEGEEPPFRGHVEIGMARVP